MKVVEKLEINPDYKYQYSIYIYLILDTIYKNDFLKNNSKLCPAKIKIYSNHNKTLYSNKKDYFN